jgi:hypothetical protein
MFCSACFALLSRRELGMFARSMSRFSAARLAVMCLGTLLLHASPLLAQPAPGIGTAQPGETPPADQQQGLVLFSSNPEANKDPVEDKVVEETTTSPTAQGARIVGPFVAGSTDIEMGSGTFVINESSRNEYIAWNLGLVPGYQFADRTRIQLSFGVSQELTQNDGDSVPHQLLLSDLRLSLSRPLYRWDSTKTQISGDIGVVAPTSLRSRFEGLYTAALASLSLQQPVGDFFFSFRTAFRKNFHRYTTPILSEEDIQTDQANGLKTELARQGGSERVQAGIAVGMQNNVSHTWSNQLLAAYSFSDEVTLSVMYALAHGWGYESYANDELTAAGAQSGSRRGDASTGDISLSYQAKDNLELATGVRTLTSPRTADDQSLRFPFYEFNNADLNLSVFYVSATLTEKIPL